MTRIFDLDHTLIAGDCTDLWMEYIAPSTLKTSLYAQMRENGKYAMKNLIREGFALFKHLTVAEISAQVKSFVDADILPIVYHEAKAVLRDIVEADDKLLISASPHFLVEPIGVALGFLKENILSIQMEMTDCHRYYTGETLGILTYQAGKVEAYKQWCLLKYGESKALFDEVYFYSDSSNDIPLLSLVSDPVVINPDLILSHLAKVEKWKRYYWTISG